MATRSGHRDECFQFLLALLILWNYRVYEDGYFMWKGKGKELCMI